MQACRRSVGNPGAGSAYAKGSGRSVQVKIPVGAAVESLTDVDKGLAAQLIWREPHGAGLHGGERPVRDCISGLNNFIVDPKQHLPWRLSTVLAGFPHFVPPRTPIGEGAWGWGWGTIAGTLGSGGHG